MIPQNSAQRGTPGGLVNYSGYSGDSSALLTLHLITIELLRGIVDSEHLIQFPSQLSVHPNYFSEIQYHSTSDSTDIGFLETLRWRVIKAIHRRVVG